MGHGYGHATRNSPRLGIAAPACTLCSRTPAPPLPHRITPGCAMPSLWSPDAPRPWWMLCRGSAAPPATQTRLWRLETRATLPLSWRPFQGPVCACVPLVAAPGRGAAVVAVVESQKATPDGSNASDDGREFE